MRAQLKRLVERTLLWMARARNERGLAGRTLVLAYHNIVPRGEPVRGDTSLHLPQDAFGRQLDLLLERFEVVPLSAVAGLPENDRPRVAITWDDAYRGAVHAGVEEVARRGLPATMFVAPGMLGGRTFWWDALAGSDGLPPERREAALAAGLGDTELVRTLATDRRWSWTEPPDHARTATEAELHEAARRPGITVGAHSWTHPNLIRIDAARLAAELERSRRWVLESAPSPIDWLAYPYGLAEARVEAAAEAAGFAGAVRIEGGWHGPRPAPPFGVPRMNVPAGLSDDGFALRLAGVINR